MSKTLEAPLFTTLGMAIIDDIMPAPGSDMAPMTDVIGGAGTYALVGARMVVGPRHSGLVSGIIDKGSDFPEKVEREIKEWNTGVKWNDDRSRLTTRGINFYGEDGVRLFEYKTSKKVLVAEDLISDPVLKNSKSVHIISIFERCNDIVETISQHRGLKSPTYIYEPLPDACVESNFGILKEVLPKIHVFSPNLHEACGLLGISDKVAAIEDVEAIASRFFLLMDPTKACVVIRCGKMGCYVKSHHHLVAYPAFHSDQLKVVDETGGGNLFCGAFITALVQSNFDYTYAAVCASIVSGCVIESFGMPKLSVEAGIEKWNGTPYADRVRQYVKSVGHDVCSEDIVSRYLVDY